MGPFRKGRSLSTRPVVFAGVLFSIVSVLVQAQPGAPPRVPGRRPIPRPRNLRVLKNLPPGQLIPVMQEYSASLGVDCDFCHVRGAFDRDDKPTKRTARQMIVMVRDINKREKVLDNKASCFMCHHGSPMPATKAPSRRLGGDRR